MRKTQPDFKTTTPGLKPLTLESVRGKTWTEDTATLSPRTREPSSRRACLVVLAGPEEGALFKLKTNAVLLIGRGEDADIRINDDGVSRMHARVSVRGNDVVLEDLDSRNGTFVGNGRIERHTLATEDLVRVGATTVLKFCFIDSLEEGFRKRLLDAALRDALTGVYNRRHFDERLTHECATARRHKRPLSLLLIDVDDFKSINDSHGHTAGDAVLRGIAQTLRDGLRSEDLPFRYGGEEFALLLRETDLAGAVRLAERLRKRVERTPFPTGEHMGPPHLSITISVGVTTFSGSVTDRELVKKADAGLYDAKRAGKNRVVKVS